MTVTLYLKLVKLKGPMRCARCGLPIQPGDRVVSKKSNGTRRYKIYHQECYEKLFV